ncbi:CD276 antigen-like [Mastacembelus armatus]|uniref:CD276 antigen-like n=1 Tax=Mastacembelus armatus TaxID=205130 RepID=A0A3Q3M320_9TELE|nr:CD276 antigen-like [Mastacembelus armatus]
MTEVKCAVFLMVLTALWTSTRGEPRVSCAFKESCILPCLFQMGSDVVIHWIQMMDIPVHSYYHSEDQLARQNQRFMKRTSLFKDQISEGNASLQLTGVDFQDQGRYKCYTSTITGNKESFITLHVDAPVNKVNIEQVENRITCSSGGIYPEPELIWSTNPPSTLTLQNNTTVQQTEQQLYNISSLLILSDSVTDLDYICTVSTNRNKRRTTLLKSNSITSSSTEATISCTDSNSPSTSLIWRFNHSQIILTQTRAKDPTVSEEWRKLVKGVSDSGSLTLQGISSDKEGIYTCELIHAGEASARNTFLKVENSQGNTHFVIIGVVGLAVIVAVIILLLWFKRRKAQKNRNNL